MRSTMILSLIGSAVLTPAMLLSAPATAQMGTMAGKWRVLGNISGKSFVLDCTFDEQGPQLGGACTEVSTGEAKAKPGKRHELTQGSVRGSAVQWSYSTKVMIMSIDIDFAGKREGARITGTVSAKGRQGSFSATRA